ncbi:hypothetical protein ACHAW5_010861 [Stephanodiscus triporus]|uniref:AB hydrolase-1 domain-containing protein n=1 Tax=Stephanodiscus triporus TaxID=2934178 RepID=A0ABD3MP34_9STRA
MRSLAVIARRRTIDAFVNTNALLKYGKPAARGLTTKPSTTTTSLGVTDHRDDPFGNNSPTVHRRTCSPSSSSSSSSSVSSLWNNFGLMALNDVSFRNNGKAERQRGAGARVSPITTAITTAKKNDDDDHDDKNDPGRTTTMTTTSCNGCGPPPRAPSLLFTAPPSSGCSRGYSTTVACRTNNGVTLPHPTTKIIDRPSSSTAVADDGATTPVAAMSSSSSSSAGGGANGEVDNEETSMDDEYGTMSSSGRTYTHPAPYRLESYGTFGHSTSALAMSSPRRIHPGVLHPAKLVYNTYGSLNASRDNVLVVCHALTGNASLEAWWGDLLGPGRAFDTDRYYVVCCNILGSCYGSVGPSSPHGDGVPRGGGGGGGGGGSSGVVPRDGSGRAVYGMDFPDVSVRDTVRLQLLLLRNELGIRSIKCVIGGSFGGMQAMEYCVMAGAARARDADEDNRDGAGGCGVGEMDAGGGAVVPYGIGEFVTRRNGRIEPYVRSAVPIACGAAHTAWQIGISETQRQAIYADPRWRGGRFDPSDPPDAGLSVARQVAMISYRTPYGYHKKFGRSLTDESGPSYGSKAPWKVKGYLEYQGAKFVGRFDPVTYVKLTEQMDSHDVGRGRGTIEEVLARVEIPVCVMGIDSDVLYPLREQEELARCMPNAELKIIHSDAGHDGFLLEQDQVAAHIKSFLYSHD